MLHVRRQSRSRLARQHERQECDRQSSSIRTRCLAIVSRFQATFNSPLVDRARNTDATEAKSTVIRFFVGHETKRLQLRRRHRDARSWPARSGDRQSRPVSSLMFRSHRATWSCMGGSADTARYSASLGCASQPARSSFHRVDRDTSNVLACSMRRLTQNPVLHAFLDRQRATSSRLLALPQPYHYTYGPPNTYITF